MFCPKCGQQQTNEEVRFCSRCGFQLGVVTALIATGGAPLPVIIAGDNAESRLIAKKRARQGAKLMFVSAVLTPFAMGLSILFDSPAPFLIPFTVFLAGLAWRLYFRYFGEEVTSTDQQSYPNQFGGATQVVLPSSQTIFVADTNRQAHRTAEIVQPPSVTEHTTRLLEPEEGTQ